MCEGMELSPRGCKIMECSKDRLDTAGQHLSKSDEYIELWNSTEAKKILLPAPKWEEGTRVIDMFSFRANATILLSFLCGGVPFLILLPFIAKIVSRRRKLSDNIYREMGIAKSILPVPLDEEDYFKVLKKEKWSRLAKEGIIFENTYIKKGAQ